ncbi:Hypothetical protein D9617_27g045120 [Elsinoe fawcettii]|nr:Hypothetical protein D9617_27g045120 [Elsinoe fawcettii]
MSLDATASLVSGGQRRKHTAPTRRGDALYRRKRIVTACQVCRARRTKCDNERPCGFCRATGAECISVPVSNDSFDPASLKILEKLDELQANLGSVYDNVQGISQHLIGVTPAYTQASPIASTSSRAVALPSTHTETIESLLTWNIWNGSGAPLLQGALSAPSIVASPDTGASDIDSVLKANYLQTFFDHVHLKNPILDEDVIRTGFVHLTMNGVEWSADTCLLLLILANGCLTVPFDSPPDLDETRLRRAWTIFAAARKRLGTVMEASLLTQARCFFYSGVFLMSMLRPYDAWREFLQGLAACQSFEARSRGAEVLPDATAEESVYWSCWKSEREVRAELGLPDFATIGLDHPRMFPSLPSTDHGEDQFKPWYFYLAEISLWRIETATRKDIAQFVESNKMAHIEELAEYVASLEDPIISWKTSLPSAISLDNDDGIRQDVIAFVLRGRLTYNYETLTWPFVHSLIHGNCQGRMARTLALRGLAAHLDRLNINRPGYFYRHHGTWLMQRSSARSALLLVAASSVLPRETMPLDWLEQVRACIEMLEFWRSSPGGLGPVADFLRRITDRSPD